MDPTYLKTEYTQQTVQEVLQSSPAVLLGVPRDAADVLRHLDIETVFDLAASRIFGNAQALLAAGEDFTHAIARHGRAPSDVVDPSATPVPVDELRFQPVSILAGIGVAKAAAVAHALDVATIRDLALWPPYRAARALLESVFGSAGPSG